MSTLLITPGFKLVKRPKEPSASEKRLWVGSEVESLNERLSSFGSGKELLFELAAALVEVAMACPSVPGKEKLNAFSLMETSLGYNTVLDLNKMN